LRWSVPSLAIVALVVLSLVQVCSRGAGAETRQAAQAAIDTQ